MPSIHLSGYPNLGRLRQSRRLRFDASLDSGLTALAVSLAVRHDDLGNFISLYLKMDSRLSIVQDLARRLLSRGSLSIQPEQSKLPNLNIEQVGKSFGSVSEHR